MKKATLLLILTFAGTSTAAETNPLSKVYDLMDELVAKINAEGEAEAKAYKEYFDWCDDMSKNAGFEIKTAEAKKEKLEAQIGNLASSITVSVSKIEDLAAAIAADDAELKNATGIRKKRKC
mmetsp:Transcript_70586/g.136214  ORF Transcript_70586/g.136214 Transcript_70586/m.136214 type:complete len:122 (-) Transcript_70586:147-512(-)